MTKQLMTFDGGPTFRVEQDYEEFTTAAPEADRHWRATDGHGHEHYWDNGWPTLEWVITGGYWCEEHNEASRFVTPATTSKPAR